VKGWHSVAVLDDDAEYQPIGSKANELDLSNIFDMTEARLCQVWQVPPILVAARIGINRATYSNYASARTSFWQDTMSPVFRRGAAAFTRGVAQEFGENLVCMFDQSNVVALQENQDVVWARALKGWQGGVLTLNEARAMVRLKRIEGGDVRRSELGFNEPVTLEPDQLQGGEASRELLELAAELRASLPEVRRLIELEDYREVA
jgi:phage portal protein BeeE